MAHDIIRVNMLSILQGRGKSEKEIQKKKSEKKEREKKESRKEEGEGRKKWQRQRRKGVAIDIYI